MARAWVVLVVAVGCAAVCDCVAALDAPDEFEVSFGTKKTLGLRLDDHLKVLGFARIKADAPSAAEASGWIVAGDQLLSVNDAPVVGKSLDDVGRMIIKADLPKVLRFRARKGEHRREVMERFLSGEGNLDHATGVMEMFSDGVPFGRVPFVQGLFGRNTSCSLAKLVKAEPFDGCTGFTNAAAIPNSIVVVQRGGCTFVDKAMNIQNAEGVGMVVVNDYGRAVRMPRVSGTSSSSKDPVHIPAVMVDEGDDRAMDRLFRAHAHTAPLARLVADHASCDAPAVKPIKRADGKSEKQAAAEKAEQDKQEAAVADTEARAKHLLQGSVHELADARAWPADATARRKLYLRLSRAVHPDAGGSDTMFAMLADAYTAANELYGTARTTSDL